MRRSPRPDWKSLKPMDASSPVLEDAKYTSVSPACSAAVLTDEVRHRGAFVRTMYSDTLEGEAAAQFAYLELGARQAVILGDGTADTADLTSSFEALFGSMGGEILSTATINQGGDNLDAVLAEISELDPDIIYAPLLAEDAV